MSLPEDGCFRLAAVVTTHSHMQDTDPQLRLGIKQPRDSYEYARLDGAPDRGLEGAADLRMQAASHGMLTFVAACVQVREANDVLAKKAHGKDESSQHAVATIDPALYY